MCVAMYNVNELGYKTNTNLHARGGLYTHQCTCRPVCTLSELSITSLLSFVDFSSPSVNSLILTGGDGCGWTRSLLVLDTDESVTRERGVVGWAELFTMGG